MSVLGDSIVVVMLETLLGTVLHMLDFVMESGPLSSIRISHVSRGSDKNRLDLITAETTRCLVDFFNNPTSPHR